MWRHPRSHPDPESRIDTAFFSKRRDEARREHDVARGVTVPENAIRWGTAGSSRFVERLLPTRPARMVPENARPLAATATPRMRRASTLIPASSDGWNASESC